MCHVPSGDFSLYDTVLDTACMLGAIPPGYGWSSGPVSLATYFALARGSRDGESQAAALEMTKWFDTNYHYLVPLLTRDQRFELTENRPLQLFREARARSIRTRPVLLGPVSFLLLSKSSDGSDPLDLLDRVLPLYAKCWTSWLKRPVHGCKSTSHAWRSICRRRLRPRSLHAYTALAERSTPDILLASYFGPMGDNLCTALRLPVAGLHLDLARGMGDLEPVLTGARPEQWISLGLIDGRNVWRADLRGALGVAQRVASARGSRNLMIAPSCSLLHVPIDLAQEDQLDPEVKGWLAFAVQKLREVRASRVASMRARRRSVLNWRRAMPPLRRAAKACVCIGPMSRRQCQPSTR